MLPTLVQETNDSVFDPVCIFLPMPINSSNIQSHVWLSVNQPHNIQPHDTVHNNIQQNIK